jgi:hypothetical protein
MRSAIEEIREAPKAGLCISEPLKVARRYLRRTPVFEGAPSCNFNKFDKISTCYIQLKSVTQSLVSLVFEAEYDRVTSVRPDRFPRHPHF